MTDTTLDRHSPGGHAGTHDHAHHSENAEFGFWIYVMSDCLLFAALFATYAVLSHAYAGGPTGRELFDLPHALAETALLLASSATYGFAMMNVRDGARARVMGWLAATFVLGLGFVSLELVEFGGMIAAGHGPDRSGFLSGFFALVGTHGLHVSAGLLWMAVMMAQVAVKGLNGHVRSRLLRLSMFWHFLDIVWIGVYTVVYLKGTM